MNKNLRRGMSKFLSMVFAMSIVLGGASKVKADDKSLNLDDAQIQKIKEQLYKLEADKNKDNKVEAEHKNPEEIVRVVVQLIGKPAAESSEGQATPQAISAVKAAQGVVKAQASVLDGAKIRHSYGNVVNGFSMDVKRKEMDRLRQLPGVKSVKEANKYVADMSNAKNLTQAFDAWKNYNLKGEGMLVAVIDSGVDYTHKDMRAPQDSSKLKLTKDQAQKIKESGALKADKEAETYFTDKIPFGYNYADRSNQIIDIRPDAGHGLHVAGIVGANGTEEEVKKGEAVQGVAPEAQLLALKVFSNGPLGDYAYTDDTVAAIEDAVTLGADVINMSLGASASFQTEEDPEQVAVKNATDKGVTVVISSGNSSYATAPYRDSTMRDIGVAGSPGLAKDSLMVASVENSYVTGYVASFMDSKGEVVKNSLYKDHTNKFKDNDEFEIINCGVGKVEDFAGKDLKGKVALIRRGDLNFTVKLLNAQAAGAAGAIVYNTVAGGEELLNMATDPNITIPAIFIGNSGGQAAVDKLSKGEVVKFKLPGKRAAIENPNAGDFADSSSWGCAPNLDFKPQISAPGGNIFSTFINNGYATKGGTSMAAPHVSGSMALILEGIKGYNKTLQGRDLVNYAKNIAMNTSQIRMDVRNEGIPYSPRRQGAGLIQISDAIKNKVAATYNGTAAVALKEIKDKKVTFAIDLNNYGDKDATYTLENFKGVLSQADEDIAGEMAHDVILDSSKANITFDVPEVTVKAGSSAKVNVTLNIGDDFKTENFLEGYIKFNSKAAENPSLVVPFMGYYGDWSKERIINYAPWENPETVMSIIDKGKLTSKAAVTDEKEDLYTVSEADYIAISPNDDKNFDELIPYLYMLRNAKRMTAEVLDESGNVVQTVGETTNIKRNIYDADNGSGKKPKEIGDLKWDGKAYNKTTGKREAVKEGQYSLNIKAYADIENAKPQEFKIPVKVDLTAPTFEILSADKSETNTYTVEWKQKDNLSGVSDPTVALNGKILEGLEIKYDEKTDVYSATITLNENQVNSIVVSGIDNAYNFGAAKIAVQQGEIAPAEISFDNKAVEEGEVKISEKDLTAEGTYKVIGKLTSKVKVFKIGNKDVTINDDLTFAGEIDSRDLVQGFNRVPVYAENYDGTLAEVLNAEGVKSKADYALKVYFDSEAPTINLQQPVVDKDGNAFVNKDEITLKGVVSDSGMGYCFYINGERVHEVSPEASYGHEVTAYNFEKTIAVKTGDILELKATDNYGHETVNTIKVTVDKEAPNVTVTGVENGKVYDKEVTPEITVDDKDATLKVMLNGKEYDGKTAIKEEGKYKLEIVATDKAGNAKETAIEFEIKLPSEDKNEEKPADNNTTTTDKLAKTGSVVSGNLLMSLGATLMGLGAAVFSSKKRKEE